MNTNNSSELILSPKYGFCNDVRINDYPSRKMVWFVPHIVKHRVDEDIIIWRCNWGNVCRSRCLYAMARDKNNGTNSEQELLKSTYCSSTLD